MFVFTIIVLVATTGKDLSKARENNLLVKYKNTKI